MAIRYMNEVAKDIEKRGEIKVPDNYVTGSAFEKWLCDESEDDNLELKSKQYVLVSQGIEIFRTEDKQLATNMMNESNDEWYKYCEECANNNERAADNEVFMYEEDN